jgi:hypothetical protein
MIEALIPDSVNTLGYMLHQSLIPMMAVHFVYDLTAGMLIPRWVEAAAS